MIGAVSLLAILLTLEQVIKFINFGALIAFTSVNVSVIAHYFIRSHKRSFLDCIRYLLLPLIGAAFTMWLWSHLEMDALILGGIWMACGLIYLVYMTKWFRKPLPEFYFDKEMIPENDQDIDQEVISQQVR